MTAADSSNLFFTDTATTAIYTLSLHDALPICCRTRHRPRAGSGDRGGAGCTGLQSAEYNRRRGKPAAVPGQERRADRKSTRLNSSHTVISYAVFCLKKKKNNACIDRIYTNKSK